MQEGNGMSKIKILFLAASPTDSQPLELDREARQIERTIRASEYRDSMELITKWAVSPDDLLQALNQHRPHIVHFSGHGSPSNEIILESDGGTRQTVSTDALRHLFAALKDNVRAVILNACYSSAQAEAVTEHIDCAIGMSDAIPDEAAIDFAASLYRAIGFGRSVQNAFEQGIVSLKLKRIAGVDLPRLHVRAGVDASQIVLIEPDVDEKTMRATAAACESAPLTIWREKLAFFQRELALCDDDAQRDSLRMRVQEIETQIADLENP
jgi:hypothetical protein